MKAALALALVTVLVVQGGASPLSLLPEESNLVAHSANPASQNGGTPIPRTIPHVTSPGNVSLTLCLESGKLLSGNATCPSGGNDPLGVAYDTANGYLYLTNEGDDNVTAVNGTTNQIVGSVSVGLDPTQMAYDSTNDYLYVANAGSDNVTVIDGGTDRNVGSISVGSYPIAITYDSANGYLYVANLKSDNLTVINGQTDGVVRSIAIGDEPDAVAYDAENGFLYVANYLWANVTVVNGTTDSVVGSISVWGQSAAIAYDNANGILYLAEWGSKNLTLINGGTGSVVGSISVGSGPEGLLYDRGNGYVYVANEYSNNVTVIDAGTERLVGSVSVKSEPDGMAYDSASKSVYVCDSNSAAVSILSTSPTPIVYPVNFTESGLPTLTNWSVTLNGTNLSSTTNTISFRWPNGTYAFTVGTVDGYTASPSSGNLTVSGASASHAISFSQHPVLTLVALDSLSEVLHTGNSVNVTASASCAGGGCPVGVTYGWSLNNSLGVLNVSSGPRVIFTAGSSAGLANLTVTANLGGVHVTNYTSIAISSTPPEGIIIQSFAATPSTLSLGKTTTLGVDASDWGSLYFLNFYYRGLPPGCSSMNSPSMNCTPTSVGSYALRVFVNDSGGRSENATSLLTVNSSTLPTLSNVSITPSSQSLQVGYSSVFTASPTCSGGACPSGTSYSWSLSNKLADLNASSGRQVEVTAGATTGKVTLFVNATLNGLTKSSSALINVTAITLESVSLTMSPTSPPFVPGEALHFSATPTCTGACPSSGIVYVWSLANPALGSLNASTGSQVTFTAGTELGKVTIFLNATLNGVTEETSAYFTLVAKATSPPWYLGLSGYVGSLLYFAIIVAVAVAVVRVWLWKRKGAQSSPPPAASTRYPPPTEPSPSPQDWSKT